MRKDKGRYTASYKVVLDTGEHRAQTLTDILFKITKTCARKSTRLLCKIPSEQCARTREVLYNIRDSAQETAQFGVQYAVGILHNRQTYYTRLQWNLTQPPDNIVQYSCATDIHVPESPMRHTHGCGTWISSMTKNACNSFCV